LSVVYYIIKHDKVHNFTQVSKVTPKVMAVIGSGVTSVSCVGLG